MTLSLRARRPYRLQEKTRHEGGGGVAAMRIGIGESFAQQRVGTFEHRPPTTRASLSSNDSNPRSLHGS